MARDLTYVILDDVFDERVEQDEKWGEQNHPDGTGRTFSTLDAARIKSENALRVAKGTLTWQDILEEEVIEAFAETDSQALIDELVQVAAVAVAWIECIERRRTP